MTDCRCIRGLDADGECTGVWTLMLAQVADSSPVPVPVQIPRFKGQNHRGQSQAAAKVTT